MLAANFVDRLELLNVADVDIDPAYVVHRTASGFDRGLQVLARLCCDVTDPRIVPSAGRAVIPEMSVTVHSPRLLSPRRTRRVVCATRRW
jgi:hypothetical protein